jgi:low temperature requirement protein LtrA
MKAGKPEGRLQRSRDLRRSTLVELFFDLVFVFALTQLSQALIRQLTWGEFLRVLLLTMAVWWAWSVTAWVTDLYESQQPGIQWLVIAVMFGVLLMASALPEAFDQRGLVFAGAYVTLQTGRTVVLLLALPERGLRRGAARVLFWFGIASVAWLTGAFVTGTSRVLLWAVAVAVDYGAAALRWPTPGLGRSSVSEWGLAAEHLSERYRQILIIALGDTILTIGSTYSAERPQPGRTAALATAFVTTVLLWRIYSYRAGARISTSFTSGAQRARPARELDWNHLAMVVGIVVTAVGNELVILHPFGHVRWAWIAVILGGPVLFLTGRAHFGYVVFGYLSRPRLVGLLVLAAMTPAMILLPPVIVALAVDLVLIGVISADLPGLRTLLKTRQPPPENADVATEGPESGLP